MLNEGQSIKDGEWNGSGLHTNYRTNKMRERNGYIYIETAVKELERNHMEHMKVYGKDIKYSALVISSSSS